MARHAIAFREQQQSAEGGMSSRKQVSFKVRRVVTGHDDAGKAVVVEDGPAPNTFELHENVFFAELWSTADAPVAVDNGADPTSGPLALKPPQRGSVFRIVSHPPEDDGNTISKQQAAEIFSSLGSAESSLATDDDPHSMMHRTETVDFGVVLEGRICLVLDDSEIALARGDVVIQRGTRHAWVNRSDSPCVMAFVLLDGKFAPALHNGRAE